MARHSAVLCVFPFFGFPSLASFIFRVHIILDQFGAKPIGVFLSYMELFVMKKNQKLMDPQQGLVSCCLWSACNLETWFQTYGWTWMVPRPTCKTHWQCVNDLPSYTYIYIYIYIIYKYIYIYIYIFTYTYIYVYCIIFLY